MVTIDEVMESFWGDSDYGAYLVREWGLPAPIVLLDGDGHYWVGLDYRECGPAGEPSVAVFDTDRESSVILAADFETFLRGLTAAEPFE
ncbi:SMI1/KNR4 family protein [Nocardia sp. NPDC051052]|uniref:SMI1/KNR4 family protein n=1 Tax=Nocardia sp. NPDC051052 TaxID=3364322 RepID=UPI0037B6F8DB